jgi:hypothetical protein
MVLADKDYDERLERNVGTLVAHVLSRVRALHHLLRGLTAAGDACPGGVHEDVDAGGGGGGGGDDECVGELSDVGEEVRRMLAQMDDVQVLKTELGQVTAALEVQGRELLQVWSLGLGFRV